MSLYEAMAYAEHELDAAINRAIEMHAMELRSRPIPEDVDPPLRRTSIEENVALYRQQLRAWRLVTLAGLRQRFAVLLCGTDLSGGTFH